MVLFREFDVVRTAGKADRESFAKRFSRFDIQRGFDRIVAII